MTNEIKTKYKINFYKKQTFNFTIIFSCISSILIMSTPYRMDIYDWTCSKHFHWLLMSLSPLLLFSLISIVVSSFLMNYKKNLAYEKLIIISSIFSIPGVILGDLGQFIFLLCGPFQPIYLPTTYFALAYFLFMAIWGSILLTRKKIILKQKSQLQ
ncbi:MAG: hypothetical protein FK733_09315 [Asgard group archaeon]|nr:hypothetical protein [Asgard group archaeon]